MAESFSETGEAAARGALEASLTYIKVPQGGKFLIHISTDISVTGNFHTTINN